MKIIPLLKKKTFHKVDPDSLAMALNWDRVARESLPDADWVSEEEMQGESGDDETGQGT